MLRLEAAGYAVAGKTNLHEFAYGISSQNPHFGTVPNPRAPGRLAGGSSGGSAAAIAAGDVELALGTDSGGSIRIPAAWCGIVGFKPTFELVPADGCFPLAPSYDHVGPMASTVEGCVELMHGARARLRARRARVARGARGRRRLARRRATRSSARASRRRRRSSRAAGRSTSRWPPTTTALFMREVADVHRGLFPENADAYGDNVRTQARALLRGDRRRGRRGAARPRRVPRALRGGARRRRPARDADGRLRRAARRRAGADDPRAAGSASRTRSTRSAGLRSRSRAAPQRTVSRPPSSSSGRAGDDSRVLAAGSAAGIPRSRDGWGLANAENEG